MQRTNKRFRILGILIISVFVGMLLFRSFKVYSQISEGNHQIAELNQKITGEKNRTKSISKKEEYMKSDAYKEKVAKEKLGLVKDGEIVFRESD